jgi:hypothetical protein
MDLGQRASAVKFLIRNRAGQFTGSFDAVFTAEGIRIAASPPQAPRANAICERVVGTLRRELLDRLLIVNEQHLHRVLTEYLRHYNTAHRHRSLGQLTTAQAETCPPGRSTSPSTGSTGNRSRYVRFIHAGSGRRVSGVLVASRAWWRAGGCGAGVPGRFGGSRWRADRGCQAIWLWPSGRFRRIL